MEKVVNRADMEDELEPPVSCSDECWIYVIRWWITTEIDRHFPKKGKTFCFHTTCFCISSAWLSFFRWYILPLAHLKISGIMNMDCNFHTSGFCFGCRLYTSHMTSYSHLGFLVANRALIWWMYYRLVSSHHTLCMSVSSGSFRGECTSGSTVIMGFWLHTVQPHFIETHVTQMYIYSVTHSTAHNFTYWDSFFFTFS